MKILSYSGEAVVTSDLVSAAVIDYARGLAADNAADVVEIPVVSPHGRALAKLLIGPTSQLIVVQSDDSEVDLDDSETVADLRARMRALGPARAAVMDHAVWVGSGVDLDDL